MKQKKKKNSPVKPKPYKISPAEIYAWEGRSGCRDGKTD